ncbi:MAG: ABC transporter permease [Phycisphaerae bacterium]|nr:ABC transporter permease [Phycisphaerae bacterium]
MIDAEPEVATERPQSLWRLGMRKLRRHRIAVWASRILILLYLSAIFADFLAPYGYDNEERSHSYHWPWNVHVVDAEGNWHLPFVYPTSYQFDRNFNRVYTEDTSKRFPVKLLHRGDPYRLLWIFPTNVRLFGVDKPARIYLLGADYRGRDLLSRIIYGGQISLSIGLVGVSITFVIGMIVGGISGYSKGAADFVIQRICEMIMLIPGLYLLLVLRAAFPPNMSSVQIYFGIVFILAFIGWAGFSRVIRGMVLSIVTSDYVVAARALGVPVHRIIIWHVLPNTLSYAIVSATLSIPAYILGESGLSLIGLGIQDPIPSWGNLLQQAMSIPELKFHPWILIPGAFIFLAVMAFNFLGDGLRDAFDPRSLAGQET